MTGPLDGLKVLDLSRVLAGPYCTQMLGDMGAEIVKIEKPFAGDDTRAWGPPFLKDEKGNDTGESAYYLSINRNKKSLALDIAQRQGQEILLQLLETSDVLIENFKTGSLVRYGLDYASLKDRFPQLVYCSITGFGQTGPLAGEPGYDLVAQAMGGLMSVTGEMNGDPSKAGVAVSDILTGLHAAVSILSALHARSRTGLGQQIDLSLLDCTLASMTNLAQYYLTSGAPAPRQGNAHASIAPYQAFEVRDGWLVIAVGNDAQFAKLCDWLGRPGLSGDETFATNPARVRNRESLVQVISHLLADKRVVDIVAACRELGIPAGPVNTLDRIFADPQIDAREMKIRIGDLDLVGSPLKFSATKVDYRFAPPPLGRDTAQILRSLGMTENGIADLAAQKIVQLGLQP